METDYSAVVRCLEALTQGVPYLVSNLANASALLWQELPQINWVGFYQKMEDALILGPFQGKPACIRIPMGAGVCGTAAREKRIVRVENVHEFPGHIACDSASNSEIVLPLFCGNELWGVLDIDSPYLARFTEADEQGLAQIAAVLGNMISAAE